MTARVSPYHLSDEARAVLASESQRIRAHIAQRRAQRQAAPGLPKDQAEQQRDALARERWERT